MMAMETLDWTWLDAQRRVEQAELEHMCSLTSAEIDELVEYGALVPVIAETTTVRQFSASCVAPLREATRLRADYDLDLFTGAAGAPAAVLLRVSGPGSRRRPGSTPRSRRLLPAS
jgi:chaperone modulatory protein CbpM